jgi:hypothetical protein
MRAARFAASALRADSGQPMHTRSRRLGLLMAAGLLLALTSTTYAQAPSVTSTPSRQPGPAAGIGFDAFGGAGITWPAAADSVEAAGLDSQSVEVGGGARVTGLWRQLFAQVAFHRWSDSGERVFVDSTGARFSLGIPLAVKGTYLDISAGWKAPMVTSTGRTALWSYVAAGAGVASYSEESPFAEAGEDIDTQSVSYHVLGGVEVPIVRWLAAAFDLRYRFVPDVLGEDGVSGALGEDVLGGVQASAGLRVGFGVGSRPRRAVPAPPSPPAERRPTEPPPAQPAVEAATIIEAAPVFLRPDAQRVPLRTLTRGTAVRVLEEAGDWVRIEFSDPQFGSRIGYVQRKFVQIGKR